MRQAKCIVFMYCNALYFTLYFTFVMCHTEVCGGTQNSRGTGAARGGWTTISNQRAKGFSVRVGEQRCGRRNVSLKGVGGSAIVVHDLPGLGGE